MRGNRMVLAAVAGALAWYGPAMARDGGADQEQPAQGTGAAQEPGRPSPGGEQSGRAGQGTRLSDEVKTSIQRLHAANQSEIALARRAQTQAQNPEVKQYAQALVQGHQRNDQRLKQVAQRMGLQLQGEAYREAFEEQQGKAQELQQQRGSQFDRGFMSQMVDSHDQTLDDVQDAARNAAEQGSVQLAQVLGQSQAELLAHRARAQQIWSRLQPAGEPAAGTGTGGLPGTAPSAPAPMHDDGMHDMERPVAAEMDEPRGAQPDDDER